NQDPFDKLLNFCATLKSGSTYFFQRDQAQDPTHDWTALPRNQQLYQYLQNMTNVAIPGFGGNFNSKFGGHDRDQILTEIFDYIRSGPNLMGAGFAVTQSVANSSNIQALSSSNSYSFTFPNSFTKDPNYVVPINISSVGSVSVSGSTKGFGNGIYFIQQAGVAFFCEGMNLTGPNGLLANGTSVPFGGQNSKISYTVRAAPLVQLFRPTQTWDNLRTGQNRTDTGSYSGLWLSVSLQGTATITPAAGTTGTITAGSQSIAFPNNDPIPVSGYIFMSPIYSPGRFYNWEGQTIMNYTADCSAKTTKSGNFFESGNTVTITYNNPMTSSTASFFNVDPTSFDSSTWSVTNSSGTGAPNATAVYDTSNPIIDISGSSNSLWMHFSGMTMTVNLLASATGPVLHTATVTIPSGDYPVPHWNFNQKSSGGAVTSALMYYNGSSGGPVNANASTARQTFQWIENNFRNRLIYNSAVPTVLTGYDFNGWLGVDGDVILTEELKANSRYNADLRLSSIQGLTPADVELAAPGFREPKKHFYAIPGSGGSIMRNSTCGNLLAGNTVSNSPFEEYWDPLSTRINGVFMDSAGGGGPGDWDNLPFDYTDGPFLNYPDTGVTMNPSNGQTNSTPYKNYTGFLGFTGTLNAAQFVAAYSPNRQMYSPFQFGSLPSRVWAGDPWETLLFCPNPAAGRNHHRGYKQSPKDYLLGDLFWMPIVDPYPISEPLSTAGKINLNYAIAPFNYITRKTGLWAALKASRVTAIDTTFSDYKAYYKYNNNGYVTTTTYVHPIDIAQTLSGMDQLRFNSGDVFRSPTEIAEIFLVPSGQTYANTEAWWAGYQNTGDNTREQPYAYLLPRLTTKSNTYTVHYRVQTLKKLKNDPNQGQWVEGRDVVSSEFRGSATIERYIDPNDPTIPDFATQLSTLTTGINLSNFYRWRTVQQKQFIP
ncbi:MAG: Verru_Chthon cassette protein A, partial [Verrucomicrobiota bacterium]